MILAAVEMMNQMCMCQAAEHLTVFVRQFCLYTSPHKYYCGSLCQVLLSMRLSTDLMLLTFVCKRSVGWIMHCALRILSRGLKPS